MSMIKSSKIILLTIILLVVVITLHSDLFKNNNDDFKDNAENGTVGPEPPEIMANWYVPSGIRDYTFDSSPYFPSISQYSDSVNYTRSTIMTVWYFEDYENLEKGEQELYNYLQERGKTYEDNVDITNQLVEVGNDNTIYGPKNLNVTRYESKETSGYFAVIVKPFGDNMNNYYIIYYGTNEKSIAEEEDVLKKMMAKEYRMNNKKGYVRGLIDYNA